MAGRSGLGTAALAALLLLLSGMIIGCLGILGAYLGRIYDEVKGRPLYLISERYGYDSEQSGEDS